MTAGIYKLDGIINQTNHNPGIRSRGTRSHGHESRGTQSPLNQRISLRTAVLHK